MILKTITIQGFKSFASRIRIDLPVGVAAIVGPNGSGKSNISDAIRWVMGEQSIRLLRGSRLEDVIFAGSDSQKPVGMAEVSLTFDNTDGTIPLEYSEVTVTRRLFRSGESDFLINKNPCRLRDIQELFLDTGVGRGSLAIIGQGQVDSILSAKPEDRRAFLDEAAGIAKYRVRKREAVNKLKHTEDNLLRVTDIIAEVEDRLQPLARQSEAARTAREVQAQLRSAERIMLQQEYDDVSALVHEENRHLAAVHAKEQEIKESLHERQSKVENIRSKLRSVQEELDAASHRQTADHEGLLSARHQREMAAERLEQLRLGMSERSERIQQLEDKARQLAAERANALQQLDVAAEANKKAVANREHLEQSLQHIDRASHGKEEAAQRFRRRLIVIAEQSAALRSRIDGLQKDTLRLEADRTAARVQKETWEKEMSAAAGRRKQAEHRLDQLQAEDKDVHERISHIRDQWTAATKACDEAAQRLEQARSEAREIQVKQRALAAMESGREGYAAGVRQVLAEAERRGWDLLGAVAQLIRVEQQVETAVEIALGPAAQFIIAQRSDDAQQAIEYLKKQRVGRVTFLPLDRLAPALVSQSVRQSIEAAPGVLGFGSDLVQSPPACQKAVDYLLGRIVITEDLDAAVALAHDTKGFARAVSLEGDVVVPGGAMSGGRHRRSGSQSLIGRGRRLRELAERAKEADAACLTLADRFDDETARVQQLQQQLTALETAQRQLELNQMETRRDVKDARTECDRLQKAILETQEKSRAILVRQREVDEAMRSAHHELNDVEAGREEMSIALGEIERRHRGRDGDREKLRQSIDTIQLTVARAEQELQAWQRERERIEREADGVAAELHNQRNAVDQINENLTRVEGDMAAAAQAIDIASERAQAAKQAREERSQRREVLSTELETNDKALEQLTKAHLSISERKGQIQVRLERARVRREQLITRFEEKGLTPGESGADAESMQRDAAQVKKEVTRLRRRLEALGPVNMHSIEEYAEVAERHRFLTEQRADLEDAMERLQEVIERLDKQSGTKLTEVFNRVRVAFQTTFVRLFGGGQADLSFTDPDNPAESGIEIMVQPPGKKMQSLLALSGGEKALAAVALLFGLLKARPVPFCVLDEVDAALDEHNLDRFRTILMDYARETQFLVITHRQATMEGVDRLFGVTMQEAGVSTLVALDLESMVTGRAEGA